MRQSRPRPSSRVSRTWEEVPTLSSQVHPYSTFLTDKGCAPARAAVDCPITTSGAAPLIVDGFRRVRRSTFTEGAIMERAEYHRQNGSNLPSFSPGCGLTSSEIKPIELLMEFLFDFLSTLEFRPCLLNVRIARESFQQNQCLFVRRLFLVFAGDRESRGEGIELRRSRLPTRRNFQQFGHFRPQGVEIGFFSFRIIDRLFGKLRRRRIAVKHFELLLDCRRKTCSRIYEHV